MTPILSVLDLAPLPDSGNGAEALKNTIDLAQHAEDLGYQRFWVAEHHNFRGLASVAPEVLISAITQHTQTIRVGSGGVLIPNYAPLKVAEIFRTLEGLAPGRIDAGVGRAPNMDPRTVLALRGSNSDPKIVEDIARLLNEIEGFGQVAPSPFPEEHPLRDVIASPEGVPFPPIFLLGSGQLSAKIAAERGRGFAAAYFFSPDESATAIAAYKAQFVPSHHFSQPHAILTVGVICAETDDLAADLTKVSMVATLRRTQGRPIGAISIEEARAVEFSPDEWEKIRRMEPISGNPARVRAQLDDLRAQTGADEIMISTSIAHHGLRRRSYELIADEYGLRPLQLVGGAHEQYYPI